MCVCFYQEWDNSICRSYSADIQFLHPSNYPEKIKPLAFNILLTCIYNSLSIDLPLCVLKCPDKPALLLHLMSQDALSWMQIIQSTSNLQILGNEQYCELLWKLWLLEGIWEKKPKSWDRRNFYMTRSGQICVHRWWLTVPYSQAGLLVQPQCHDNIDVLDWRWLTLDSWEQASNRSHPFVLT